MRSPTGDRLRPSTALHIGGMGARSMNCHADTFSRMGYPGEVEQIQRLFLAGQKAAAVAALG